MGYRKKGSQAEESARLLLLLNEKAKSYGGSVLSSDVQGLLEYLNFECKSGHQFTATARTVLLRNGWCKDCRFGAPKNFSTVKETLKGLGYEVISHQGSLSGKIRVKCLQCGNERDAIYKRLISSKCAHKGQAKSDLLATLQDSARSYGGSLLSTSVKTLDDYLDWKCEHGHRFSRPGNDLVNRGRFCSVCMDKAVTLVQIREIISSRGGVLLDWEKGKGLSNARLDVKCSLGHVFEINWNRMSGTRGQWCSVCSTGSKSEEVARATFKQLFGGEFKKRRPKWLRNSRGKQMELDGYEESLNLAFEYQGQQHFQQVGIFNDSDSLKLRIEDDREKRRLCALHGVTLIELRWDEKYTDFPASIKKQLKAHKRSFPDVDFNMNINLDSAYIRDDRLKELAAVLAEKKITLLSTKWISVSTRYELLCNVCGHRWAQQGRAFLNSGYKPGCKKCAMKTTATQMSERKLGLATMQEYASSFGGICLSDSYIDSRSEYSWRCKYGHDFKRTFNGMKSKKSFCPTCGLGMSTIGDLQNFASKHGGLCLSSGYSTGAAHYKWQCSRGHVFTRTFNQMKTSRDFCVSCAENDKGLAELDSFASKFGGKSLASVFVRNTEPYEWECKSGHRFKRRYSLMKARASFCLECNGIKK